jgi:hypothetical protein
LAGRRPIVSPASNSTFGRACPSGLRSFGLSSGFNSCSFNCARSREKT